MLRVLVKGDSRFPVSRKIIKQAVAEVIDPQGSTADIEVSVRIGGDRLLKRLNRHFRGIDQPANVLSFCQQETGPVRWLFPSPSQAKDQPASVPGFVMPPDHTLYLGDVVVSYPQARTVASSRGILIDQVIIDWVKHGVRHLLGEHSHENN